MVKWVDVAGTENGQILLEQHQSPHCNVKNGNTEEDNNAVSFLEETAQGSLVTLDM